MALSDATSSSSFWGFGMITIAAVACGLAGKMSMTDSFNVVLTAFGIYVVKRGAQNVAGIMGASRCISPPTDGQSTKSNE